jgi:hypothetical protein
VSADAVRDALARTLAAGTAQVHYTREASMFGVTTTLDARGTIEFAPARHRLDGEVVARHEGYSQSEPFHEIDDSGAQYTPSDDGRWHAPPGDARPFPGHFSPMWLLQVLDGAVAAVADDDRLHVIADIVAADERSASGVRAVPEASLRELRALEFDVWLDGDGRIARIATREPWEGVRVEFEDFGGPPPVEIPA